MMRMERSPRGVKLSSSYRSTADEGLDCDCDLNGVEKRRKFVQGRPAAISASGVSRKVNMISGSQARPGNGLAGRLCLQAGPRGGASQTARPQPEPGNEEGRVGRRPEHSCQSTPMNATSCGVADWRN